MHLVRLSLLIFESKVLFVAILAVSNFTNSFRLVVFPRVFMHTCQVPKLAGTNLFPGIINWSLEILG